MRRYEGSFAHFLKELFLRGPNEHGCFWQWRKHAEAGCCTCLGRAPACVASAWAQ